jgi:hypothetical protein
MHLWVWAAVLRLLPSHLEHLPVSNVTVRAGHGGDERLSMLYLIVVLNGSARIM